MTEDIHMIEIETKLGNIRFYCPPGKVIRKRAITLLTKEPETIEWIDTFVSGDVLWDVGANVGCYSLYAALKKGVKVLAFEPAANNYYILNFNIESNGMDDRISAFCIAFNDVTKSDLFNLSSLEHAMSMHCFGSNIVLQDKKFEPKFRQGMLGYSIDDFIKQFNLTLPTHIKIDVDGNEGKIIDGATKTISNKRVKTILIEIDTRNTLYSEKLIKSIESAGFELCAKRHADKYDKGPYRFCYNHIFIKI